MDERMGTLSANLEAIRRDIATRRGAAHEAWQARAIEAVIVNLDRYLGYVREALAADSTEDATAAACRVAGIRKGIGDLGVLDPEHDQALIDMIDETDVLATRICAAG